MPWTTYIAKGNSCDASYIFNSKLFTLLNVSAKYSHYFQWRWSTVVGFVIDALTQKLNDLYKKSLAKVRFKIVHWRWSLKGCSWRYIWQITFAPLQSKITKCCHAILQSEMQSIMPSWSSGFTAESLPNVKTIFDIFLADWERVQMHYLFPRVHELLPWNYCVEKKELNIICII